MPSTTPSPRERAEAYLKQNEERFQLITGNHANNIAARQNLTLVLEHIILDAVLCERRRLLSLACPTCNTTIRRNRPP